MRSVIIKLISVIALVWKLVIISVFAHVSISETVSVISWSTFVSTVVAHVVISAITAVWTAGYTVSISPINYVSSAVIVGLTDVYIFGIWISVLPLILVSIPDNSVSIAENPLVFIVMINPVGPVE